MIVTEYVPVPELVVEPPPPLDPPPVPPDPPLPVLPVEPPLVLVEPLEGFPACPPPQPRTNPITNNERKDFTPREDFGARKARLSQSSPMMGRESDSDALKVLEFEDRGLAVMVNTE